MRPAIAFGGAVIAAAAWAILAFVAALPTGWVHLLLGAAATLVAVGIVKLPPRSRFPS